MPNVTEAGRIFIREGTRFPEALQIQSEPYRGGWRLVKHFDCRGLDRKLDEAGWTFSCTDAEINLTGLDEQDTIRKAIARALAEASADNFNSLEITRVATAVSKRFPGVCSVTISIRSRRLQEKVLIEKVLMSDEPIRGWGARGILDEPSPVIVLRARRASHLEEKVARDADVCQVIQQRLEELGLEQRDLAAAATVTESYVSQLLTRNRMPPASERTDIYDKMAKILQFPAGKLSKMADLQRKTELRRTLADAAAPQVKDVRELILRKCACDKQKEVRAIFEKEAFGELESLVTQKLLDTVKGVAKKELENEKWLHLVAQFVDEATNRCASPFSNSWTRISSTFR